jgi:hypothetical protein
MTRHHVRREDGTWEEVDEPLVTKTGKELTADDIEQLADEAERDYSITEQAGRIRGQGWIWEGVLHLMPGVTLEEADAGGWTFMGPVVDSEGNVLREATPLTEEEVPD